MTLLAATEFHRGEFAWLVCVVIGATTALLFVRAAFVQRAATDLEHDADRLAAKKRGQR